MKRTTPAFVNNREPIADVLTSLLPSGGGRVLEIASGPGAHAAYFADRFSDSTWQPSDVDTDGFASIEAWRASSEQQNLLAPIALDAAEPWPDLGRFELVLNINMVHVSAYPRVAAGLLRGAAGVLVPGGVLALYGPYLRNGVETAPSNVAFDARLRNIDPEWGLRSLDDLSERAQLRGLVLDRVVEMPSNNVVAILRAGGH